MTQPHDIRHHNDGSIDFDFYRAQALTLRSQAMRDAFKLKAAFRFTLITLTMIVGAAIAASAPAHRV
jgi:hypothetical protein